VGFVGSSGAARVVVTSLSFLGAGNPGDSWHKGGFNLSLFFGNWGFLGIGGRRDVVFLLGTLGAAGTLATVVIGGTVIGGGALLFLGVPLLLLFSPILVPGGIIATIVTGAQQY